jgi:dTMP kinase
VKRAEPKKGVFITIEGIHGCGKSTIRSMVCKKLRNIGLPVVDLVDQRGTVIGRKLRKINLNCIDIDPLTEALLIAVVRRQNVVEIIKPNLLLGRTVICERYTDAFFAFQGFGRGLPMNLLHCVSNAVNDGIEPCLTILLDADPQITLSRIKNETRHRIEKEPIEFHERVRKGYLEQAKKYPQRIRVLNAALPIETVFQNVWREIEKLLFANRSDRNAWV